MVAGERPVPALLGGAIVILGVILADAGPTLVASIARPFRPVSRPAVT